MEIKEEHKKYLKGLNLNNWDIIGFRILTNGEPVIIMRSKDKLKYTAQYRGCGQYFDNTTDLFNYIAKRRWKHIEIEEN